MAQIALSQAAAALVRMLATEMPGALIRSWQTAKWCSLTLSGERHQFELATDQPIPADSDALEIQPPHILADIVLTPTEGGVRGEALTIEE